MAPQLYLESLELIEKHEVDEKKPRVSGSDMGQGIMWPANV